MRSGVLSDAFIKAEHPAFFTATDATHLRTLSRHHKLYSATSRTRGRHRPTPTGKPSQPYLTLMEAAQYRANPYEAAHEMVLNYQAAVAPPAAAQPGPSYAAVTPKTPGRVRAAATRFDVEHPGLVEAPLSDDTKAFIYLSGLDPDRVLESRETRFANNRVYFRNSLQGVEQRALDMTSKNASEFARVLEAIDAVREHEDEDEGSPLFDR